MKEEQGLGGKESRERPRGGWNGTRGGRLSTWSREMELLLLLMMMMMHTKKKEGKKSVAGHDDDGGAKIFVCVFTV